MTLSPRRLEAAHGRALLPHFWPLWSGWACTAPGAGRGVTAFGPTREAAAAAIGVPIERLAEEARDQRDRT